MIDATAFNTLINFPFFWQTMLLTIAVLTLWLLGLLVRIARLNREIKAMAMRLNTLEDRLGQQAPLQQEVTRFPKTNLAHYSSKPNSTDVLMPKFPVDSMIERAISMVKAGETADKIQLKLGIEPKLLAILVKQHKPA